MLKTAFLPRDVRLFVLRNTFRSKYSKQQTFVVSEIRKSSEIQGGQLGLPKSNHVLLQIEIGLGVGRWVLD